MKQILLTRQANNDLSDIYQYGIEQFGAKCAKTYMGGLEQCLNKLAILPNMGRDASDLMPKLQRFGFKNHLIFYLPMGLDILVVRILGKHMDHEPQVELPLFEFDIDIAK